MCQVNLLKSAVRIYLLLTRSSKIYSGRDQAAILWVILWSPTGLLSVEIVANSLYVEKAHRHRPVVIGWQISDDHCLLMAYFADVFLCTKSSSFSFISIDYVSSIFTTLLTM